MKKAVLGILLAALGAQLLLMSAETAKFRFLAAVYADDKGAGMKLPEGVACNDKSLVIVGDTGNDRLLRFTAEEKTLKGGTAIKIAQLLAPTRVQLNSKGEIFALDGKQRRVVHLSPSGEFKEFLSLEGAPPPTTVVPKSFKIDSSDNIYILDVFSARVLVLGPDGKFQKAIPVPAGGGFISDLAVDFAGNVLLIDSIQRKVYTAAKDAAGFSPLGASLGDSLSSLPSYLTTIRGAIFIVEGKGSSIVTLGQDGSFLARQLTMGWNEGTLNYPSQMCVNSKDEVFIADRDNSRIQEFTLVR